MSLRPSLVALPLSLLVAGACAATPTESPPERALFRLSAARVIPSPAPSPDDAPGGPPTAAWQIEVRLLRPDGTAVASPRVVTFPGQRACIQVIEQVAYVRDFDVTVADDAFIADPVISMLQPGVSIDLAVFDVAGRTDEAALAWSFAACDLRRPLPERELRLLASGEGSTVKVQFPVTEEIAASGALRVPIGTEQEIARLPDPSGAGEIVFRGRVERVTVPRPAEENAPAEAAFGDVAEGPLGALGRRAASGADAGSLRVTAVRLPPGVDDVDARGVERLARLEVASVLAPGVRGSDLLRESFVAGWKVGDAARESVFDPVVDRHESGLAAEIADDGTLRVRWSTTPRWQRLGLDPAGPGPGADAAGKRVRPPVDQPETSSAERRIPLAAGRSVHPVFRLPDGGTAALVVEVNPRR